MKAQFVYTETFPNAEINQSILNVLIAYLKDIWGLFIIILGKIIQLDGRLNIVSKKTLWTW